MLSDEEQFAVLRQCPESVFDDHLQVVALGADGFHFWAYGVVVGDGTLVDVLDAVGHAAGFCQLVHQALDALRALGNLLDELHVTGGESLGTLGGEYFLHALYVLDKLALIVG